LETALKIVWDLLPVSSDGKDKKGIMVLIGSDREPVTLEQINDIKQSMMAGTKPLATMAAQIHKLAVEKGWWDSPNQEERPEVSAVAMPLDMLPEKLLMLHTEISEVVEAFRLHKGRELGISTFPTYFGDDGKPEGIAIELADLLIRLLDICAAYNIDLDEAVRTKYQYNKNRPFRHGNKRL